MADTKSDRLGVRGVFALFDSTLRLLGGANATGLLAAGVTYHAFEGHADIQYGMKLSGIFFLFGVMSFTLAYVGWFLSVLNLDWSLQVEGEEGPEQMFWPRRTARNIKRFQTDAKIGFYILGLFGALSFIAFIGALSVAFHLSLTI